LGPVPLDDGKQVIHGLPTFDDHPEMVKELPAPRLIAIAFGGRNLMEREIVASRTEIHILGIRFPDDFHPKESLIETAGPFQIDHA
jgi:hypothetical protein